MALPKLTDKKGNKGVRYGNTSWTPGTVFVEAVIFLWAKMFVSANAT